MYYRKQLLSLQKIFGTSDISITSESLRVGTRTYPIRQDVIDLTQDAPPARSAEDIQFTFGEEWKKHGTILPEHSKEFSQYFDLVDVAALRTSRICDLGCGAGRWSFFLKDHCQELILIDFSDAIYVARENLRGSDHCLFFKADLTQLPFADNFADFIYCLGVLHHLPMPCLEMVVRLKKFAPQLLIFLYYALDNRPFYFRWILGGVTTVRMALCRIKSPLLRNLFSTLGACFVYWPLVALGHLLDLIHLGRFVPLYEFYRGKSLRRLRQDVYDRFFTRIEQRVSRAEIQQLASQFSRVTISPNIPYWHFLLNR